MPCEAVNHGTTLLFMGAASRVCGGGDGSVRKYSSTYSLTLTRLSYAANLSGAMIRHAPMHTVLKTCITKISELKLRSNELSSGGEAYGVGWGKSQLGTLRCGRLRSQRLTD